MMKERSFRFSLMDIFIIAVILVIGVVIFQKVSLNNEKLTMPQQDIQLTIVLEEDEGFVSNTLEIGDPIYQKGSIMPLGYIRNIEVKPSQQIVADQDGKTFIREVPQLKDTEITIAATGFISIEGRPVIDNNIFYLNQYLPVYTHNTTFSTRVVEIIY